MQTHDRSGQLVSTEHNKICVLIFVLVFVILPAHILIIYWKCMYWCIYSYIFIVKPTRKSHCHKSGHCSQSQSNCSESPCHRGNSGSMQNTFCHISDIIFEPCVSFSSGHSCTDLWSGSMNKASTSVFLIVKVTVQISITPISGKCSLNVLGRTSRATLSVLWVWKERGAFEDSETHWSVPPPDGVSHHCHDRALKAGGGGLHAACLIHLNKHLHQSSSENTSRDKSSSLTWQLGGSDLWQYLIFIYCNKILT